jgi:DNA-binding response OmpR family regulator
VARILIAEDDPLIGSFIEKGLRSAGFSTFLADDGEKAQALCLTDEFDLMVLDMGLPGREGFHVLQEVRARGKTLPIIVLTGRRERDAVECLEAGADDYMKKPFHFEELLARVRTRLRDPGTDQQHVLSAGDVRLDLMTRRATVGERTVELTAREFALLETFLRHADQVLSREQLLSHVWGFSFDPTTNLVNVYVNVLRKKLGEEVIETVRGVGYRLRGKASEPAGMSARHAGHMRAVS